MATGLKKAYRLHRGAPSGADGSQTGPRRPDRRVDGSQRWAPELVHHADTAEALAEAQHHSAQVSRRLRLGQAASTCVDCVAD